MQVELNFFATFRETVGEKTVSRELAEGATVGDVLTDLEREYEGLSGQLLDDGDVRPQINVLRNGREVARGDGTTTAVEDGDTIAVFPPVAGG